MADLLTPNQRSAFNRALKHVELLPLLYSKVKELYWFDVFQNAGLLDPNNNPAPQSSDDGEFVTIQTWPITEYLLSSSENLHDPQNKAYAVKYLQLIRDVTRYAIDQGYGNYRTWWQFSKIIKNIPTALITSEDLELIEYWISDRYERGLIAEELGTYWLLTLLDEGSKHGGMLAEEMIGILYSIDFEDRQLGTSSTKQAVFRFDKWYAQQITEKCAYIIGRMLGVRGLQIFNNQLIGILKELGNDNWSEVWQPAIEEHEQNKYRDDAENILITAYRESLNGLIEANIDSAKQYLEGMLAEDYVTINRLAVFAIDHNFKLLRDKVDELLDEKYFDGNFRHEFWNLLNHNYNNFSGPQKRKVIDLINGIKKLDEKGRVEDGATAYSRATWLAAIKDYGEEELSNYNSNIDKAGVEPEHPAFSSYMSVGWGGHESPFSLDELSALKITAIVETLNNFEDPGKFREPGIEGLAKTFNQLLKAEPLRFYSQLGAFVDLDLAFVYEAIEAFRELWSEKSQLPWDDIWPCILKFCSMVIKQDRFWSPENQKQRGNFVANRYWIVSSIGRLIESGAKSDDHAFSAQYIDDAEDIINYLLSREEGNEYGIDSDAVSISINSPRGHCLEAMINLTLLSCRISDNKNNDHTKVWKHYQTIYDSELKRGDSDKSEYEFATLVTNYLPNFMYMSKAWVLDNLINIFDQSHYLKWLCAMQGYAYVGSVYQEIYQYLKEHGDFIKVLDDANIRNRVEEKVIQNIAIAYIHDFEKLTSENSLINELIERNDYEELRHLIWFIWTLRNSVDKNLTNKVLEIWAKMQGNVDVSTIEGKKLASQLCHWVTFLDEIDDDRLNLLFEIVPYADVEHNSYDLLKSIAKISKTQPYEAYQIMLKMLEETHPDYPEDAIRLIFSNLTAAGAKGLNWSKIIVDRYLKKGISRPFNILNEILGNDQHI